MDKKVYNLLFFLFIEILSISTILAQNNIVFLNRRNKAFSNLDALKNINTRLRRFINEYGIKTKISTREIKPDYYGKSGFYQADTPYNYIQGNHLPLSVSGDQYSSLPNLISNTSAVNNTNNEHPRYALVNNNPLADFLTKSLESVNNQNSSNPFNTAFSSVENIVPTANVDANINQNNEIKNYNTINISNTQSTGTKPSVTEHFNIISDKILNPQNIMNYGKQITDQTNNLERKISTKASNYDEFLSKGYFNKISTLNRLSPPYYSKYIKMLNYDSNSFHRLPVMYAPFQ